MMTNRMVSVFLLVLVFFNFNRCSSDKGFTEYVVKPSDLKMDVKVNGTLESSQTIKIGCPNLSFMWDFVIAQMAKEGQEVKEGDIILQFDNKEIMKKLDLKQSELQTAQKELETLTFAENEVLNQLKIELVEAKTNTVKAKNKTNLIEEYTAMNEIKKINLDYALAQLIEEEVTAKTQYQEKAMKAKLQTQQNLISKLTNETADYRKALASLQVKSPKQGIISYCPDHSGKKNGVGDTVWMGIKVLEIPNLQHMQAVAAIPEFNSYRIKEGMKAEIRIDSNSDIVFTGEIVSLSRIYRTKSYNNMAIVVDAVICIDHPDEKIMRPGMNASISIITEIKRQVIKIPLSAVNYKNNQVRVLKKSAWKNKELQIETGLQTEDYVEVTAGLKDGDILLIPRIKG
jgi:multidrug efflux pump subunit AcrA (membrane-fusion protein)